MLIADNVRSPSPMAVVWLAAPIDMVMLNNPTMQDATSLSLVMRICSICSHMHIKYMKELFIV